MLSVKFKSLIYIGLISLGVLGIGEAAQAAKLNLNTIAETWIERRDSAYFDRRENNQWGVANRNGTDYLTNEIGNFWTDKPNWSRWVHGVKLSPWETPGDFRFSGTFQMRNDNDAMGWTLFHQDQQNHLRIGWTGLAKPGPFGNDTMPSEGWDDCVLNDRGLCYDHPDNTFGFHVVLVQDGIETELNFKEKWWRDSGRFARYWGDTPYWERNYDFDISFIDGELSVAVKRGDRNRNLIDLTFNDLPFSSGRIGLRHLNQEVIWSDIGYEDLSATVTALSSPSSPVPTQANPEPITILGAGTAIGFGSWFKKKISKQSKKKDKNA